MKVAARIPRPTRVRRPAGAPNAARRPTPPNSTEPANSLEVALHGAPQRPACAPALVQWREDTFQFTSVLAQICLIQLLKYTEHQYAARKSGGHRLLQTGQGWRIFSRLFALRNAIVSVRVFEHLLRFANQEADAHSRAFFLAYAPLSFEHDSSEEYIGPGVWTPDAGSRSAAVRVRRTLKRWCEWLEALAHLRIHQARFHSSDCPPLDEAIIFLWPLHQRHQWNGGELLRLLRASLGCADVYPCGSELQLAAYCRGALGLWRVKPAGLIGRTVLPGHSVAERLLEFLPAIH